MKEAFSVHKKMENNEYCVFMLLDFPSATILNVMASSDYCHYSKNPRVRTYIFPS